MMFFQTLSFGVVSAPMSYSLNLFLFPWIELLNERLTSIFSDFISASFIGSRSLGCHATRFFSMESDMIFSHILLKRQEKRNYLSLWEMVLYSVYRKRPHHGRYPRSVRFLECGKY